jgi:hypothetical protein
MLGNQYFLGHINGVEMDQEMKALGDLACRPSYITEVLIGGSTGSRQQGGVG